MRKLEMAQRVLGTLWGEASWRRKDFRRTLEN